MLRIRCQKCSWGVCGGGRIFGRGFRKKGGSNDPPEPPWLRACVNDTRVSAVVARIRHASACLFLHARGDVHLSLWAIIIIIYLRREGSTYILS